MYKVERIKLMNFKMMYQHQKISRQKKANDHGVICLFVFLHMAGATA
jgi:hypothetical protein